MNLSPVEQVVSQVITAKLKLNLTAEQKSLVAGKALVAGS